jgi:hypothetical protein
MELTIGVLRQIIADLPDDVVLSTLEYGNANFKPFTGVKRVLLLRSDKQWGNKTYLSVNGMGSHFTGEGWQKGLFYERHWDETTMKDQSCKYKPNTAYYAKHKPSGEQWYLLGIDPKGDRVCVAGYPPTIGKLSDCENLEERTVLTDIELAYRTKEFGINWL